MNDKSTAETQVEKPDLKSLYRPLGLKAVAAAAMMIKRTPVKAKSA